MRKAVSGAARWLVALAVVVVPTALLAPRLVALEAVMATVWALSWVSVQFAPPAYEKPVWWCRLKLEWWAWRAQRRRRRDRAWQTAELWTTEEQ